MQMKKIFEALRYAIVKHKDQHRKSSEGKQIPYIVHPLEVCSILHECGVRDEDILVAAILHDTLEDTEATSESLHQHFGPRVRYIVEELTDDKNLSKKEQKLAQEAKAPYLCKEAKLIKAADKTSNVRDIRRWPPDWSKKSMEGYVAQATRVVTGLNEKNELIPQLEKEFWEAVKWTNRYIRENR